MIGENWGTRRRPKKPVAQNKFISKICAVKKSRRLKKNAFPSFKSRLRGHGEGKCLYFSVWIGALESCEGRRFLSIFISSVGQRGVKRQRGEHTTNPEIPA